MEELTVFIRVKIDNLNALSKEIPEIVKNEVKINRDIINNNTDKKYLEISSFSKLIFKKKCLLRKIFLGFTCEIKLLIANLNKA
jgi:hypothetical protein